MALATAEVEIIADTSGFERSAQRKLSKTGDSAGKSFKRSFQNALSTLSGGLLPRSKIRDQAKQTGASSGKAFSKGFRANIRTSNGDVLGTLRVKTQAAKKGGEAGNAFTRALKTAIGKSADISPGLPSGGGGAKFAVLGAAAAAASAALGPLLGLLAGIPAAVGGATAAFSTLAVAVSGTGEAFGAALSGNVQKMNEAMKGLAPNAKQVARDLATLSGPLDQLKTSVQGAFFKPLIGQFNQLSGLITGPLKTGMSGLATAFGKAASQAVQFFATRKGGQQLKAVFNGVKQAVQSIAPAIQPLLSGFGSMAAAIAPKFAALGQEIGSAAKRFGQWMSRMASSGQAMQWINGAVGVLRQLANAAKAAAPGFKAIGSVLGQIGAAVRGALAPLATVFSAIAVVAASTLRPVLSAVGGVLKRIGTAVQTFAPQLRKLAPVFGKIGRIVGGVVTTAFNALAPVIAKLAPIFTRIASKVGSAFLGALLAVAPFLKQLATQVFPLIGTLIAKIAPLVGKIATAFFKAVKAAAPLAQTLLGLLIPAFRFLMPIVVGAFQGIKNIVVGALKFLRGIFMTLHGVLTGNWSKAWEGLKTIVKGALQALWGLIQTGLIGRVIKIVRLFGQRAWSLMKTIWSRVSKAVGDGVGKVMGWVRDLPGKVKGFFSDAGTWLLKAGKNIIQGLIDGIRSMVKSAGDAIGSVAQKIRDYLPFSPAKEGPLSGAGNPENSGRKIGSMVASGVRSQQGAVNSAMRGLTAGGVPAAGMSLGGARPMPASGARMSPHRERSRATTQPQAHYTTHVDQPQFYVTAPHSNPDHVARRTANRLARLASQ